MEVDFYSGFLVKEKEILVSVLNQTLSPKRANVDPFL